MQKNIHETHNMKDQLLPFVFHTIHYPRGLYPSHWHEEPEIIYCIAGSGTVRCNEEEYCIRAGDILVINANCIHFLSDPSGMEYHCLILDLHFCQSNGIPINNLYFRELIRDETISRAFLEVFHAQAQHKQQETVCSAAAVRARVLDLLCMLCADHIFQQDRPPASRSADRIKQAMIYIKERYAQNLSLNDIAMHVGVSKYYLSREFKSYTGRTVFDTLVQIRCVEAKQLIRDGHSVSEAARSCGFESLSYFSRIFKKLYGVPPSYYLPK